MKLGSEAYADDSYRAQLVEGCVKVTAVEESEFKSGKVLGAKLGSSRLLLTAQTPPQGVLRVMYRAALGSSEREIDVVESADNGDGTTTIAVDCPEGDSGFFRVVNEVPSGGTFDADSLVLGGGIFGIISAQ